MDKIIPFQAKVFLQNYSENKIKTNEEEGRRRKEKKKNHHGKRFALNEVLK